MLTIESVYFVPVMTPKQNWQRCNQKKRVIEEIETETGGRGVMLLHHSSVFLHVTNLSSMETGAQNLFIVVVCCTDKYRMMNTHLVALAWLELAYRVLSQQHWGWKNQQLKGIRAAKAKVTKNTRVFHSGVDMKINEKLCQEQLMWPASDCHALMQKMHKETKWKRDADQPTQKVPI